jgi:Tfp pilus assembly protein PilE
MNYQLMGYNFTTIQLVIAAVVIVVLILAAVGVYIQRRKRAHHGVPQPFRI